MNKISKKLLKISAAVIFIAALLTGTFYLMWRCGAFLPNWIKWQEKSLEATVDNNCYEIALDNKKVSVSLKNDESENKIIWTTKTGIKDGIKVQDIMSCDIDGDLACELVVLCWRIGHYGKAMPFWEDEDKKEWAQHLYVYEYNDGEISPKWMSSYLGFEVKAISANLLNPEKTTKNAIIFTDSDDVTRTFIWNSWGFECLE